MSVNRTDYLVWGAKLDPGAVEYDEYEAEMYGEEGRRFDMVYDGMSGKYAIAGKIVAKSDPYEGIDFIEISPSQTGWDPEVVAAVRRCFPDAHEFRLYLFSHFS